MELVVTLSNGDANLVGFPYGKGQYLDREGVTHSAFLGYHRFIDDEGEAYGSFEVFYGEEGAYWWPCSPGCLPDSEDANGPFDSAQAAYLDAVTP